MGQNIFKDFVSFSEFLWFKIQKVEERKKGIKEGKKEEWKERREERSGQGKKIAREYQKANTGYKFKTMM